MALSMEEQRILAEIEQRLAKSEPVLAARLASFGRPRPVNVLRTPRVRVLASCVALVVVTVVSLIAYALLPLRALPDRGSGGRATPASRQPTMTLQQPALRQNGQQPSVLKGLPSPTLAEPR
jgi:DUF3040 family protein